MHEKKPVGIWVRVSHEDQVKGESPEHHEARARAYAEAKGWEVATVYRLDAVCGKSVKDHPECVRMLSDAAEPSGVRLLTYPRHVVRAAFAPAGVHTKSAVAELLAARFPELLPRLPRPRQNWESEDPRMAIFDAAALALTHLDRRRSPQLA